MVVSPEGLPPALCLFITMFPFLLFVVELLLLSASAHTKNNVSLSPSQVFAASALLLICPQSKISWGPCDPSVVTNSALSCGFFKIPLDYHDPSAGSGRLYVAKINATVSSPLGTLYTLQGASAP